MSHRRVFAAHPTAAPFAFVLFIVAAAASSPRDLVVEETGQGALGVPRVHVQLRDGRRTLTGEPSPLAMVDEERAHSFLAYLDTGASGYVISEGAMKRFGVERQDGAVYVEVGLHGETEMGVTDAYTIAIAGAGADPLAPPPASEFEIVDKEVAMQIRASGPGAGAGAFGALFGDMNVIGMPAIRKLVIEIDPEPMRGEGIESFGAGPIVRLSKNRQPRGVEIEIPLEYIDFNLRNHPENRGSLPELDSNPMIIGVETEYDGAAFKGDWLLDTGAMASIISTAHAQALGLFDANEKPTREPDFTLPLGDIGGSVQRSGGYVIDRLRVQGADGGAIEFRDVSVVVKDVGTKLNNGDEVILDGVFGMNLLLPSASGFSNPLAMERFDGAFDRVWIDGKRGVLALDVR